MNEAERALQTLISHIETEAGSDDCYKVIMAIDTLEKAIIALVAIKELFDFDFALRIGTNQKIMMITNKRTNEYWEIPLTKEEYDPFKK